MKKWQIFTLILGILLVTGLLIAFDPEDKEPLGTEETGPGRKWYRIDVADPCGNYIRKDGVPNHLRMKFFGDFDDLQLTGLTFDPNHAPWLIVDNAIPDPNDPNQTLEGHFWFSKVWRPGDYEIGFQVADSNTNTDCKWGTIIVRDKGRPKVKSMESGKK